MINIKNNKVFIMAKMFSFFTLTILLIVVYCILIPKGINGYKVYTFTLISIIYLFIILCSLLLIDITKIDVRELFISFALGIASIFITIPVNICGILSGICTSMSYLIVKCFISTYGNYLDIFPSNKSKLKKDLSIIIIISTVLLILKCYPALEINRNILFTIDIPLLFRSLGAGISEEMIFRALMYGLLLKIGNNEEKPPFILVLLIMTIPFTLLHFVEPYINYGLSGCINLFSYLLCSILLALLLYKRDIFTATIVHMVIDVISKGIMVEL